MAKTLIGDTNSITEHGLNQHTEDGVCEVVSFLLYAGKFHIAAGLPKVLSAEKEMKLNRGIADFVLFHADGSISVVEAKKYKGSFTHIASAIGQVMFYACQLSLAMPGKHVRPAIVTDVNGNDEGAQLVSQTADRAGVDLIPLGPLDVYDKIFTKAGVYG